MNLGQIKNRIMRALNNQYTEPYLITDLVNEALGKLMDAGKITAKTTIALVSGTNKYALPTDFRAPGTIQDETMPDAAIRYPLLDIGENGFGYAIESGFIYIKPVPSSVVTLSHYYYKFAVPLVNDDDTPIDIDAQYHHLLALYAMAMIIPMLRHDTSSRYAIMAQNMYETRQWQMWTDGLAGFQRANERKNKLTKVNEKVIW